MNLTERINHGFDLIGAEWVMWLLLILSALSLARMVERWLFLRKRRVNLEDTWQSIEKRIQGDAPANAEAEAEVESMEERVALSLISQKERPAEALEDIAIATAEAEKLKYNHGLSFLATVGSNAPFIGLLGTVVGIVEAFARLAEAVPGGNRSQLIMASLAEALAATAVGLVVAIPAIAAYNWFQRQVEACETRSNILVRRIIATKR